VVPLTEWTARKGKIKTNVRVEPSMLNGLSKLSLAEPTGDNRGLFANSTYRSAAEVSGGERGTGSGCVGGDRSGVEGGILTGLGFWLAVRMIHTGAIRLNLVRLNTQFGVLYV
jgi:hypothetical protein